ncbi:MAG: hypothetical protein AAF928_05365 [Myxococcota bacterium]
MQTLAELVDRLGPLRVRDAIGWTLRAALSVWELHREGRVHGRLGPAAIEVERADCSSNGVLCWAARLEDAPEHHSLERGPSGVPSHEDDVWALSEMLYFLLTGVHPYPGGVHQAVYADGASVRPPKPIAVHNSDLDVMQPIVDRLLHDPRRGTTIEELVAGLQDFSPATADMPPLLVEAPTTSMPPPGSRFPARARRGGPASDARTRGLVAALVAAGAVAVGVAFWLRRDGPSTASTPPVVPGTTAATDESPKLVPRGNGAPGTRDTATPEPGSPKGTASSSAAPALQDVTTCLTPFFAPDAFAAPSRRELPCRDPEPKKVSRAITAALTEGAQGRVTQAARDWSQLGWYRLAAITVIRGRCCPEPPPPLTTPALLRTCELDAALRALTEARGDEAMAEAIDRYGEAVRCAHAAGGGELLGLDGKPDRAQAARFLRMLTRARRRRAAAP